MTTAASESIQVLAAYTLQEAQIENLVTAKGYADCVAFMGEDGISVVVSKEDGERAITLLDKKIKEILLSLYDKLPKVQKNQLPDFSESCTNFHTNLSSFSCRC